MPAKHGKKRSLSPNGDDDYNDSGMRSRARYEQMPSISPSSDEETRSSSPLSAQTGLDSVPPPDSRSGTSGGFFEQAHEIAIHGGQFQHTMGHHTSVVVNLSGVGRELHEPTTSSHSSERTGSFSAASTRITSTSEQSPPRFERALSQESSNSEQSLNENAPAGQWLDADHRNMTLTSRSIIPRETGDEIYQRHLQTKRRGFPLWIPEPNMQLPLAYRKTGVRLGDVGIVTPFGGFAFLFNVCVPSDDPINPAVLPEGFVPISPPIVQTQYRVFKSNSYLASSSIEESRNDASSAGLSFITSASEGAILTIPEGAITLDLENITRMRAYATKNIHNWYRYVNGTRGLEAKNGDIRLVIGCDKTTSWGMAALSNVRTQGNGVCHLRFKPAVNRTSGSGSLAPAYTWEHSGMADVRVGPDPEELDELRQHESRASEESAGEVVNSDPKYHNQCLFIRTLNIMLGKNLWATLSQELAAEAVDDLFDEQSTYEDKNSTYQGRTKDDKPGFPDRQGSSHHSNNNLALESRSITGPEYDVTTSVYPNGSKKLYHPSNDLNVSLLNMFPHANMVATCDQDWLYQGANLKSSLLDMIPERTIGEVMLCGHPQEEGVIFLEQKHRPVRQDSTAAPQLKLNLTLEEKRGLLLLTGRRDISDDPVEVDIQFYKCLEPRSGHAISSKILSNKEIAPSDMQTPTRNAIHHRCDICPKIFKTREYLIKHYETHLGIVPKRKKQKRTAMIYT